MNAKIKREFFSDESYSKSDRDFLSKVFDEYADDDIINDPLLLRKTVAAVKTLLQADKIDRIINAQLCSDMPDSALIGKLSTVKASLLSGFSLPDKNNGGSFTKIMKELNDAAYDNAKPDLIDAKLAGSYREIAAMNAEAVIKELNLAGDEFAQLAARQSAFIKELQEKIELLEEELRRLKRDGEAKT